MNDKELADKIVAHGVGEASKLTAPMKDGSFSVYSINSNEGFKTPKSFVHDWRVAGAMLDKVHDLSEPYKWMTVMRDIRRIPLGDPLERTISEICCQVF